MSEAGGGGDGGAACGFSHPDQSASWSMAMQSGDVKPLDVQTMMKRSDPRFVIGGALVFFVAFVSLPYVLDAVEDQKYGAQGESKVIGEQSESTAGVEQAELATANQQCAPPVGTDLNAPLPGSAADLRSPASKFNDLDDTDANAIANQASQRAQQMQQDLNVSGLLSAKHKNANPDAGPDLQFDAAMASHYDFDNPHRDNQAGSVSSPQGSHSAADAFFTAVDDNQAAGSAGPVAGARSGSAPSLGSNASSARSRDYTKDAVSEMVSASGMAPVSGASSDFQPSARSASVSQPGQGQSVAMARTQMQTQMQVPVQQAAIPEYGGVVPSSTQPYMIFVPGQIPPIQAQAAPMLIAARVPVGSEVVSRAMPQAIAGQPLGQGTPQAAPMSMSMPQGIGQPSPVSQPAGIGMPQPIGRGLTQGMVPSRRASFNPNTSAIVSPLGMRHHVPAMPAEGMPQASAAGEYGGGRMRMYVAR